MGMVETVSDEGHMLRLDIEDFRPHDLRRTAATYLAQQDGVDRTILAKILNHKDRGVTSIYDQYSYDKEKRRALELWAEHLSRIAEDRGGP